jgi:hypothetical protein
MRRMEPPGRGSALTALRAKVARRDGKRGSSDPMVVNIYLFIELLRAANAADVADHIKSLSLANCKFANVVVLSFDKLVAQLDCSTAEDGTKVVLQDLPGVEGVVQTNVVAVVEPVH